MLTLKEAIDRTDVLAKQSALFTYYLEEADPGAETARFVRGYLNMLEAVRDEGSVVITSVAYNRKMIIFGIVDGDKEEETVLDFNKYTEHEIYIPDAFLDEEIFFYIGSEILEIYAAEDEIIDEDEVERMTDEVMKRAEQYLGLTLPSITAIEDNFDFDERVSFDVNEWLLDRCYYDYATTLKELSTGYAPHEECYDLAGDIIEHMTGKLDEYLAPELALLRKAVPLGKANGVIIVDTCDIPLGVNVYIQTAMGRKDISQFTYSELLNFKVYAFGMGHPGELLEAIMVYHRFPHNISLARKILKGGNVHDSY